jgi:hypothetical protein
VDVGAREQEQQRQAGPATEQGVQPIAQEERAQMVGGRIAEGGIGIGPTPGQAMRSLLIAVLYRDQREPAHGTLADDQPLTTQKPSHQSGRDRRL